MSCPASDQCHLVGVCDPLTGLCSNPTKPDGTACNDGNLCTTVDACAGGVCTGGPPLNCSDGNPCTDDLCDAFQGCKHFNNAASCNDGNACTTNDVCITGVCVGGNTAPGCGACQAVAAIPAQGGTFAGQTAGTGTLAGSCGTSGSSGERVYVWVPPTSGVATIQTCGTGTAYDTVLYLRSGSCTGTELACNDDTTGCAVSDGTAGADHHGSKITPTVTAGQPYYIVVDGFSGKTGAYALTVFPPSVCGNNVREGAEECDGTDNAACVTHQCTAQCTCVPPAGGLPDLTPGISNLLVQRNTTVASGDVAEGCAEATSGIDLLRFSVASNNIGTADFFLGDPGCPLPCSTHPLAQCSNPEFICSPAQGHNHAHYTDYARYELLDATSQAIVVGHKQGFCLLDYNCPAGVTPKYSCTNQGITAGCSDVYSYTLGCQYLDITGIPPGSYTLRVTMDPFNRITELSESNNVATLPVVLTGTTSTTSTTLPTGCANPTILPAGGGTFTGTTAGPSGFTGCVAATGSAPEAIFQWTPTTSGTATIQTCGAATTFDTVLSVLSGTCAGPQVACNDDTAGCATGDSCGVNSSHHGSRVTPVVTAGQTYTIVVDGYGGSCGGASGTFVLTVTPPAPAGTTSTSTTATSTTAPSTTLASSSTTVTVSSSTTTVTLVGGACASPVVVPAGGGTFSGTTAGASTIAGCVAAAGNAPEVAFQWTPAVSGTATIQTCGAGTTFDTVLYVRSGTCTGAQVACNDDATGCPTGDPCAPNNAHHGSLVTPAVTAGQTYFIVVDGYAGSCGGASGSFVLTVTPPGGAVSTTSTVTSTSSTTTTTVVPGACVNPQVLPAAGGTFTGATSGASTLGGCVAQTASAPEKVFQWTPIRSGTATIQTCGAATTFDTVVSVLSGSCTGTQVACNDDTTACPTGDVCTANNGHHGSLVTPAVTAGQTYFIVVDGYAGSCGGSAGNFVLTVTAP